MSKKSALCLIVLVFMISLSLANERPEAISPGKTSGMALVDVSCPTFSWTSVTWARSYRVAVFESQDLNDPITYQGLRAMGDPIIEQKIRGNALSWTPSAELGLHDCTGYVWFVKAVDVSGVGIWSSGSQFKVELAARFDRVLARIRSELKEAGVGDDVLRELFINLETRDQPVSIEQEIPDTGTTLNQNIPLTSGSEGDANNNVYYGSGAGNSLTSSAYYHSFFGYRSGYNTYGGQNNTFAGYQSGYQNQNGGYNTYIGYYAGHDNTTGDRNTNVGYGAGWTNTGSRNVFLGNEAGRYETGNYKLYIESARYDEADVYTPLIYGEFNNNIVSINGKLGVGTGNYAPTFEVDVDGYVRTKYFMQRSEAPQMRWYETDGSDSADFFKMNYHADGLEFMWYDASTATTYMPIKMEGNGYVGINNSSPTHMLDVGTSGAYCNGGAWVDGSSIEFKENVRALSVEDAQKTLEGLKPVIYNYKQDKEEEHLGFIAEDVPELVAMKDRKGLSTMDLVSILTKVVQDQQKKINRQKESLNELREIVLKQQELLSKEIDDMQNLIKRIERLEQDK